MPPKVAVLSSAATILWGNDTSMAESSDIDLILIIRGQL